MGVKILSLFDGMACGMIAMQLAGVEVESYDAYEIDKYAIKTAQHNFPMIKEHGDVFDADFTQYEGVDFLIGGSPCTYWSIAQTKNRETVASGMGWELFSQYVRALHEAKPKYFIYENNKSMSKQIRASIDEAFGFEAVLINSALVSAQNRQRLYWVGRRNENGTYSKVNVEQPADRGILLKDVLDSEVAWKPMEQELQTVFNKDGGVVGILNMKSQDAIKRVYGYNGKAPTLTTCGGGHREPKIFSMVAEPVHGMGNDTKSRTLTANYWKTNVRDAFVDCAGGRTMAAEPINTDANEKAFCVTSRYYKGFGNNPGKCLEKHRDSMVAEPINITADGKEITIYEVRDGKITIKGKQYPIKLKDGFYIIRKLTVSECKRLQTVPEWYEFPVSNSQAYKMLGNGWTCEIICHLINSCFKSVDALPGQIGLWG